MSCSVLGLLWDLAASNEYKSRKTFLGHTDEVNGIKWGPQSDLFNPGAAVGLLVKNTGGDLLIDEGSKLLSILACPADGELRS